MYGRFRFAIFEATNQSLDAALTEMRRVFEQHPWLKHATEIVLIFAGASLVRTFGLRLLKRWEKRVQPKHKHFIVLSEKLITPALLIAVMAASFNLFPLPNKLLAVLNRIFYIIVLGLGIYCAARAAQAILIQWLEQDDRRKNLREPTQFAVRVVFAAFGTMIVLENLGISLTSVWTTLGVGSVAIALALQDTLTNFFAGVYLRLDNPISLGDYIKIQTGEEGYVEERGWRSTRIRSLSNNMIVVPNSKLSTSIVTNYSLPDPRFSFSIPISVNLASDPQRVQDVLEEEAAKATDKIPGLVSGSKPSVQFIPGFGANSLDFSMNCTVVTYVDQYSVQHELRKRIYHRLRTEKIEFPVPQRDIHISGNHGNHERATAALNSKEASQASD